MPIKKIQSQNKDDTLRKPGTSLIKNPIYGLNASETKHWFSQTIKIAI